MNRLNIKKWKFYKLKNKSTHVRCSVCYKLITKDPMSLFTHNHDYLYAGSTEEVKMRSDYLFHGITKETYIYLTLFKN